MSESKKIVAQRGLEASPPWLLKRSKRHEGRWYFFNTETKESAWSLPESMVSKLQDYETHEPNEPPPEVIASGGGGGVQLPRLQSPQLNSRQSHEPIIPGMSLNGGWSETTPSGRYRRSSHGSTRTSSTESDSSAFSPVSAPIDGHSHTPVSLTRRFEAKSPPQLNSPWNSPLFFRHQNRDENDEADMVSPSGTLEKEGSASSASLSSSLPNPNTSLLTRTNLGRSVSTHVVGTPPIISVSPHVSQRKLSGEPVARRRDSLSPRLTPQPMGPTSPPPITTPTQTNRKTLLKSKSTDSFSKPFEQTPTRPSSKHPGSLLVNDHSERLRLLSTTNQMMMDDTLSVFNCISHTHN
jgi:hypothetical protein